MSSLRRPLQLLALLVASSAAAGDGVSVYVNDVNVDGLKGQTFEKVNVRLDEKGNVYIDAPGYSVKRVVMEPKAPPKPEGVITRRYFLVTEQTRQGATGYDVDLMLNGKHLRTLFNSDPQLVTEVTRQLKPGRNQVVLQAARAPSARQRPPGASKSEVFRVLIGEATLSDEKVVLEKQVVTFTLSAADTEDITQEFTFTTR